MRVLACVDPVPAQDGTCEQQVWIEQPALIPHLTLQDGQRIGDAMLLALIPIVAIKLFLKPSLHWRTK